MPPPRQLDSYYPPAEMPPPVDRQPHQGISAYGRDASIGVHASSNTQSAPSIVTQVLVLIAKLFCNNPQQNAVLVRRICGFVFLWFRAGTSCNFGKPSKLVTKFPYKLISSISFQVRIKIAEGDESTDKYLDV